MKILLAIDIGNTNIAFGIFRGNKLSKRFNIPTRDYHLRKLKRNLGGLKIGSAIICSVVPKATLILKRDIAKGLGRRPDIIGKDIIVPVKNLYRSPRQTGQDRLVNAYAGVTLYGAPLIVVDFGTAVTFDVVSKDKEYLGGMILPGLDISLQALAEHAALLPRAKLKRPPEFIGRDTKSSMLSGIVYGFSGLTDDLVMRIKNKIGRNAKVIGTGGDIGLIGKYCRNIGQIDLNLTLKGLNLLKKNS